MHLLTARTTALTGLFYGVLSIGTVVWIIQLLLEGSIDDLITFIALLVVCVFMWRKYIKAFKTRMHDRRYAEAKNELWQTLGLVLPGKGRLSIAFEDAEMSIERYKVFVPNDSYHITLKGKEDVSYDEDSMTHNLVMFWHNFHIHKSVLIVEKSFNGGALRMTKLDNGEDDEDIKIVVGLLNDDPVKNRVKSRSKLPPDLLHASIEDLRELSALLKGRENRTVS